MRFLSPLLIIAGLASCGDADEQRTFQAAPAALTYDGGDYRADEAKLAHGKRMSRLLGCTGCHGSDLTGAEPQGMLPAIPNISLLLPDYSDEELDKAVRSGIGKDGRHLRLAMPSAAMSNLSDADFDAVVAYLRTIPPSGEPVELSPPDNWEELPPPLKAVLPKDGPDAIKKFSAAGWAADLGPQTARGRYIAITNCIECHWKNLDGLPGMIPSLDLAGAYEREEFRRLLREGVGKARPDLGTMSAVARNRYSQLTDAEINDVYDYLIARAQKAPSPQ